jgi:hypothetical protein
LGGHDTLGEKKVNLIVGDDLATRNYIRTRIKKEVITCPFARDGMC